MQDTLLLTSDTPIAIYGAGEVGRRFAARAIREGYRVVCFFDRKLAGGKCDGLPVLDYASPLPDNFDKATLAVVICLADGLLHKDVVAALCATKFRFFVFLPMGLPLPPSQRDALTRLYNRVIGIQRGEHIPLMSYAVLTKPSFTLDAAVLRTVNGRRTVLMDAEILFTDNKSTWKGDKTKLHGVAHYYDVNLALYDAFYSLFAYLAGIAADYTGYVKGFLDISFVDIAKRDKLYALFCRELDRGLDFFIEAAPDAEWSDAGYFNLVGGHHRTCFLFFRRHRLLPVRITEEDFEQWIHRPALEKFLGALRAQGLSELYAPVPHPAFHAFPARREDHLPSVYSALGNLTGPGGFIGETVFDLCDAEGYYARIATRLKADMVRVYAPDAGKAVVTSALNDLLHLSRIQVATESPSIGERCTFLILMDRAIGLSPEEREALIAKADALTTGRMLWESPSDAFESDCRAVLSQSTFTRYNVLAHQVVNGQRRAVAIFEK